MSYLLDTNTCIYAFSGAYPSVVQRIAEQAAGSLFISSITLAELAFGTHRGKPPTSETLEGFLREIPALPFDDAAAHAYARIPFKRASYDRLIAAHALSRDLALVSRNTADFADIPGLKIENWTQPE